MIRSGFGIYTNQAAYSIIQNAALNLPFYYAKTVANLAGGTPNCNTENILAASPTGASARTTSITITKSNTTTSGICRCSEPLFFHVLQAQYIGSYTVHADNLTLQNLFPETRSASACMFVLFHK